MMRLSEDVLALVLSALRDGDKVRVASVSRTLREIVKRAARIALKTTGDPSACLRAWPSSTRLTVFDARGLGRASLHNITDLTLWNTAAVVAPRSLRHLTLVRCACARLDGLDGPTGPAGLDGPTGLTGLTIIEPMVTPDFGSLVSLSSVSLERVSFRCIDSLTRLTGLRTLAITSPIPCSSYPVPIETVGTLTSLTSLTLRGVDALNVQLYGIRGLRLERVSIEMCMVCGDDPFLLVPAIAAREPHDCGAYTRRIELSRGSSAAAAAPEYEQKIDALARASELCEYERYIHRRLMCPLISHMHGLRLLFHATLEQFDEAYRYALRCTLPTVIAGPCLK
jgi:hypothetical protein